MFLKTLLLITISSILLISTTNATLPTCLAGTTISDPSVVGDVKFSDIKLLFSVGDTITAGQFAGDSVSSSTNEYRGSSFVNGNTTDAWTINNFLTQTVSTLSASSQSLLNGVRSPGSFNAAYDGFNGATKGADTNINSEITFIKNQAVAKVGSLTNFNNQWKMLNVYSGVFRACSICQDIYASYQTSSTYWGSFYLSMINNITTTFSSKTVINIVSLPKLSQFYSSTTSTCTTYNQNNNICPCLWAQSTTVMDSVISAANSGIKRAIQNWRLNQDLTTSTVAITYQPFMEETTFASTWISPIDCFHPSLEGHKFMAIGLWNNIRQFSLKSKSINSTSTMICGTPYNNIVDIDAFY